MKVAIAVAGGSAFSVTLMACYGAPLTCDSDSDCVEGQSCVDSTCVAEGEGEGEGE